MTLVSIIGDFPSNVLPVFYHFRNDIKNHIIAYDDYKHDIEHAKNITNGTENFIQKYNLNIKTFTKQIDEDNVSQLKNLSNYIRKFADEDSVIINITDGLANIHYTLINELKENSVQFLSYDRYDNTYSLLHVNTVSQPIRAQTMSISDHFLLKDTKVTSEGKLENNQEKLEDIKLLFEQYNGDKDRFLFHHDSRFINKKTPVGFLYEKYIANLLQPLAYDDMAVGVKVLDHYEKGGYDNEFDILVMKNNHLHMIECKAWDENKQATVSSFIYKLDSIRTTLDNDAIMLYLSRDPIYDPFMDCTIPMSSTSPYFRARAKRVYLRGNPVGQVSRFLRDVDTIFELSTHNIDQLAPIEQLPITDVTKQKQQINKTLSEIFGLKIDFFNKQRLLRLFNYKTSYMTNEKVYKAMKNEKIKNLLQKIYRIKDDSQIHYVYNYFNQHFRNYC